MKPMHLIPLRDDLMFPLEQTFNKFYDDFFGNKSLLNVAKANSGYPKINCYRDDTHYRIRFAVPGVTADDLDIEYGPNRTITIKGKTAKKYHTGDESSYFVRELRMSAFERTLALPDFVDEGSEEALLSDGILTLSWKLREPAVRQVKKIAVKSE